jgi:hypothetical protein
MMKVAFGGIWTPLGDDMTTPSTWMLAFGGLKHHLLSLEVMKRLGFDGIHGSGRKMMWFEKGICMT